MLTHTPSCPLPSPQVYPPCDTTSLQTLPLDRKLKQLFLVSVAQFRPEKNHRLQLEAFAAARRAAGPTLQVRPCGCRLSGGPAGRWAFIASVVRAAACFFPSRRVGWGGGRR